MELITGIRRYLKSNRRDNLTSMIAAQKAQEEKVEQEENAYLERFKPQIEAIMRKYPVNTIHWRSKGTPSETSVKPLSERVFVNDEGIFHAETFGTIENDVLSVNRSGLDFTGERLTKVRVSDMAPQFDIHFNESETPLRITYPGMAEDIRSGFTNESGKINLTSGYFLEQDVNGNILRVGRSSSATEFVYLSIKSHNGDQQSQTL